MTKASATRSLRSAGRHVVRVARENYSLWNEWRDIAPTLEKVRPLSRVPPGRLRDLAHHIRSVLREDIRGDFVECGVWRGGAAFLMADLLRRAGDHQRKVWLFDSFEGMPAPTAIDGVKATEWASSTDPQRYNDNYRAPLHEVQESARQLGLDTNTEFVKGWFHETLPVSRDRIGPIALLRLDCDWYDSVRLCLDQLYDQVTEGGYILLDDYFAFDGCALAVYDFLSERRLPHRLVTQAGAAYFRKRTP